MEEQCVLCGAGAAVRVGGTSFCSTCGLNQFTADAVAPVRHRRRSRRAGFFALFSSGLLVKALLGAVALAAVGGATSTVLNHQTPAADPVAVAMPVATEAESTTTVPTTVSPPATTAAAPVTTTTVAASPAVELGVITDYVVAMQEWAECVSDAASAHSGGAFDPSAACGSKPDAADFGITINPPGHDDGGPGNSEDAPGHDDEGPGNSENAPGQTKDD